jgi:hypothetical protein
MRSSRSSVRSWERSLVWLLAVGLVIAFPLSATEPSGQTPNGADPNPVQVKPVKLSTREIVENTRPTVVLIETTTSDGRPLSMGSGFLLGTSNGVVTNVHVLKWATSVSVKTSDGVRYAATHVSGIDLERDFCLLTVPGLRMRGLSLAERGSVAVGDTVLVAGNPRGLEATFSRGIVSAIRSNPDLIQIDAPISPGSSGGPVVNESGEVIGVATSSLREGQNLNFAVPFFKEFAFRELNWPIESASKLGISDAELNGLKGRPRLVEEEKTRADPRTDKIRGQPVFHRVTENYNENGMVVFSNAGYGREIHSGSVIEYWEATIMKKIRAKGGETDGLPPGFKSLDEEQNFSWLQGAERRKRLVRYGGTEADTFENGGRSEYLFDSFSNIVRSTMHGTPLGTALDPANKHVDRSVFRFDDEHRVIEETRLVDDVPDELVRHYYEVDSRGNWITDTEFASPWGQPAKATVRSITRRTISYW